MLLPAMTGSGASVFVTARSILRMAFVMVASVLSLGFGSAVVEAAVAVLVIVVLLGVEELTLTTMVKTAVSPLATEAFEKTTLPVPPTAGGLGMVQPEPVVTTADTNVVFVGTASVTVTVCASDGPLLTKLIV